MFSNSNPSGPRKRKFNPSDDCVASTSHVKKKRFKKHKKPKESSVTVLLLKKFQPILPKGKECRELSAEERIQTISVHCKMTAQEVESIVTLHSYICDRIWEKPPKRALFNYQQFPVVSCHLDFWSNLFIVKIHQ